MLNITDLFDDWELSQSGDGNFRVKCPSCESDYNMKLYPKSNTAICFQSDKWFNLDELIALKEGLIMCRDGRDN